MYVNIGIARKSVAKIFLYETKTQICLHEKIILEELQKMGYLTIYINAIGLIIKSLEIAFFFKFCIFP